MYIWTGLVFNKNDEASIREICKEINKKYKLNENSFTLPQHISLKISFDAKEYEDIIEYVKSILENQMKIRVKIIGISKINNGVIWLDAEENQELRKIHNLLNEKLKEKYDVSLASFDGEKFKFHSTLFQDKSICDEHEPLIKELIDKIIFPFEIEMNEINFGISEVCEVGTFKVVDSLILK